MSAPTRCPICGEKTKWTKVGETNKNFSVGKAAVGAALIGPVGLVGGALGKHTVTYKCGTCGHKHEYNV